MESDSFTPLREPQFISEVRELLDPHDGKEAVEAYYQRFSELGAGGVGVRGLLLYTRALRTLAVRRMTERRAAQKKPDYDTLEWNDEWEARLSQRLARLALLSEAELQPSVARFLEANDERTLEKLITNSEQLLPGQHLYIEDILQTVGQPGKRITVYQDDRPRYYTVQGAAVVAPTGIGKTVFMARAAAGLGIGECGEHGQRRRALIVVPSQLLVDQFSGAVGNDTFRRFGPDGMRVTRYYRGEKDPTGDAVIITIPMFVERFRHGKLDGHEFDILMSDEVHTLTQPQFQEVYLNHWRGPTLGFTATPGYSPQKDARNILPYTIDHIDILTAIKEGKLNGAQLFTLVAESDKKILQGVTTKNEQRQVARELFNKTAIELTMPLIAQGRRGIIFCWQGREGGHARELAESMQGLKLPNGREVTAERLSTYNAYTGHTSNKAIVRRYNAGEIDVLTSTDMGGQGFDAAIDFVVVPDVYSYLKLRQIIGRGTRRSEAFPVTIFAQILVPAYLETRPYEHPYTLYQAFGLEEIEQGAAFGSGSKSPPKKGAPPRTHNKGVDLSIFSPDMQQLIRESTPKRIGELLLSPGTRTSIPEGYICFDDIPRDPDSRASVARSRLDTAGFHWVGRYEEGRYGMVRYYEPAAKEFFTECPVAPTTTKEYYNISTLARTYGIGHHKMEQLIERFQVPTTLMLGRTHQAPHVHQKHLPLLERIIDREMPLAQPGDISIEELAQELSMSAAFFHLLCKDVNGKRILSKYRRDPEGSTRRLITKAEADILRTYVLSYPKAEPGDMIQINIMKLVGYKTNASFKRDLTATELAQAKPKWTLCADGTTRLSDNWSAEQSAAIIERLNEKKKPKVFSAHLVPVKVTDRLFAVQAESVQRRISESAFLSSSATAVSLGRDTAKPSTCIPWSLLEQFIKYNYFAPHPQAVPIDFQRLPTSPEDDDPERVEYARYIQSQLMTAGDLGFSPTDYLRKYQAKQESDERDERAEP